jgi:hypothetical protein
VLLGMPNSGLTYRVEAPLAGSRYKTVVVRPRRWSYRITYDVIGGELVVLSIDPPWAVSS